MFDTWTQWLEKVSKIVTWIGGITAAVLQSNQLLRFGVRASIVFVLIFLALVCWRTTPTTMKVKRTVVGPTGAAEDEIPNPGRRNWGIAFAALLVGFVIDLGINVGGFHPVAEIRGSYSGEFFPPAKSQTGMPKPAVNAVDLEDMESINDCREWLQIPEGEQQAFIAQADHLISLCDGIDVEKAMTATVAQELYGHTLGEHFAFDIRKPKEFKELVIEDVEIIVDRFWSLPPTPAAAGVEDNINIIVFELDKLDCNQLPWTFHPKFYLNDPKSAPQLWGRETLRLKDEFERSFLVKIGASHRGIYRYRADLIVHADFGGTQRIPLFKKPRLCAFTGANPGETPVQLRSLDPTLAPTTPIGPAAPAAPPAPPAPKAPPEKSTAPADQPAPPAPKAPTGESKAPAGSPAPPA